MTAKQLFDSVRPGYRVTIRTPQGNERTGRCVMKFPNHCVLNMGGAYGTPAVTDAKNIMSVKGKRVGVAQEVK